MTSHIEDCFAPAKNQITWAQAAIVELREAQRQFVCNDNFEFVIVLDKTTGEQVYKVRLTKELPIFFARKATEALTTTKHSFDQATFAANSLVSNKRQKLIYYPWSQGPDDLHRLLELRSIDRRLWEIFENHQPYPTSSNHAGGNETIRTLASMANNKHTIGIGIIVSAPEVRPIFSGSAIESFKMLSPKWDHEKNEVELARWIGDFQTKNSAVKLEIALKDDRLLKPLGAVSALSAFASKAEFVAKSLQDRCTEVLT